MYKRFVVHNQQDFDWFVRKLTEKQLRFIKKYLSLDGVKTSRRLMVSAVAGGYAKDEPGLPPSYSHGAIHGMWIMKYSRVGALIRAIEQPNGFTPGTEALDARLEKLEAVDGKIRLLAAEG